MCSEDGGKRRTAADCLSAIERLPVAVAARFLQNEYPQTAAFVLRQLPAAAAARILEGMVPGFAAEVAQRIALSDDAMDEVRDDVLRVLDAELPRATRTWDRESRAAQMHGILAALGDTALSATIRERLSSLFGAPDGAAGSELAAGGVLDEETLKEVGEMITAPGPAPSVGPDAETGSAKAAPVGAAAQEPSMSDILASIRKIIAEDTAPGPRPTATGEDAVLVMDPALYGEGCHCQPPDGPLGETLHTGGMDCPACQPDGPLRGAFDTQPDHPIGDASLTDLDLKVDGAVAGAPETGAAAGPESAASKVLTPEQIDELLNFDEGRRGANDASGLLALVNSALVNYERLPMLEVVFDRLARILSASLRNFTGDNVEVSLDQLSTVRFGDYLNSIPLPAMQGVFKAEEWSGEGLLVADSALIYSVVDVLLGGRRSTAPMRVAGRPYTVVERLLVERLMHVVLSDLSAAFDPVSPVSMCLDRVETNPRFATIARPANVAVLVKLRLDMDDRGGRLEVLLPLATLEPVRELLREAYRGEKFGRDPIWEHHIASAVLGATAALPATLHSRATTLAEVWSWRPGTVLGLGIAADAPRVRLALPGQPIAAGPLGERDGRLVVTLDTVYIQGDTDTPRHGPVRPVVFKTLPPTPAAADAPADAPFDKKDAATMATDSFSLDDLDAPAVPRATDLDSIAKARVTLSVVVGKADMEVGTLLKLGRGAVVELDRLVGDTVDIYVNDKKFARGEIVVVEDRIGVSFTEIAEFA